MNLSVKKTGLLFLLGALFFLSCKDSSEILLDPGDEADKIRTSFLDTFSIENSNYDRLDSFRTSSRYSSFPLMLFGKYFDPFLSRNVNAYSYAEIGGTTATLDSAIEYTSLKLVLDLDYQIGNKSGDQDIFIHQLQNPIDTIYYDHDSLIYKSTGPDISTIINTKTTFKYSDVDTRKNKVEIDLNNDLGISLYKMLSRKSDTLTSQKKFREFFKGIRIFGGDKNSAVFGVLTRSDSSYIKLEYKRGGQNVGNQKIVEVRFPILLSANNIERHDVPAIPNYSFVQSGTGLATKISFPTVKKLKDLGNKLAINRALLFIEPEYENNIQPPSNLYLVLAGKDSLLTMGFFPTQSYARNLKTVQSSTSIISEFQAENLNALNVSYNPDKKHYSADVTSYIEALLKDNSNYFTSDLILYSEGAGHAVNKKFSYTINSSGGIEAVNKDLTINRAVIQKQKIKLKIYYTLVD